MVLGGFFIFFLTIVNDILYARYLFGPGLLAPVGLYFFIFAQAAARSRRIAIAFNTSEKLSKDLEGKVERRTRALSRARASAEEAHAEIQQLNEFAYSGRPTLGRRDIDSIARYCEQIAGAVSTTRLLVSVREERIRAEELRQESENRNRLLKCIAQLDDIHAVMQAVGESVTGSGAFANAYRRRRLTYYPRIIAGRAAAMNQLIIEKLSPRDFIIAPLIVNEELIAFAAFMTNNQGRFKKEQLDWISVLCDQIAGVIHMNNLMRTIRAEQKRSEEARRRTRYTCYMDNVHDETIQWLKALKIPPGSDGGSLQRTFARGKPLYLTEIPPGLLVREVDRLLVVRLGLKGIFQIPLRAGNESIGVLAIGVRESISLSRDDRSLLQAMCDQIAGAVRSAGQIEATEAARVGDGDFQRDLSMQAPTSLKEMERARREW